MKGRVVLAGLAVAVAAALAFLIISAKTSSSSGSKTAKPSDDGAGIVAEAEASEPRAAVRKMKADDAPPPPPTDYGPVASTANYSDYIRPDGSRTRDHRRGDRPPPDLERSREVSPKRGKVQPDVILAVRRWLRPRVAQCSRDYASDVGEGAKIDVRLQVSITGGVVSVARTVIIPKNVSGGDLTACIEQAVRNMELETDHAEDVAHHMLTFPFPLPMQ